ncbi:MAG: D-alanyl-D-alanine carboxypeptidase [Pseudomonadota bacterium]
MIGRRVFLGGALSGLAGLAEAQALTRSIRPMPRGGRALAPEPLDAIFGASGLREHTSFLVIDAGSGVVLEGQGAGRLRPPASVAKVPTALFARARLGAGSRRVTRLLATGPVINGRVQGDLILAGGGDPALDTDGLADLAQAAAARGIFGVTGRFLVYDGALPSLREIDPTQPEHVGYNPAIAGLNLNFNRVHFQWWRTGEGYRLAMTARAKRFDPAVQGIGMRVVARDTPVFAYRSIEGRDDWSVARSALGRTGSRWLPVRTPGAYAGEVFRTVAAQYNLRLPQQGRARSAQGREVARVESAALDPMLRALLRYSTNLTAEAVGLAASGRGTLARSGGAMSSWLVNELGVAGTGFANHSGLSDESRTSPEQLVAMLASPQARAAMPDLLRAHPVAQEAGARAPLEGVEVRAKTGTLNFTRALAGYIDTSERRLIFAIQAAELDRRYQGPGRVSEAPRGARSWANRAVAQEQALLRRWARLA